MIYKTFIMCLAACCSVMFSVAEGNPRASVCEKSFEKEAPGIAEKMRAKKDPKRWDKYGKFLKKYGGCLDGQYAQTVQAISEVALAHDWEAFGKYVGKKKNRDEAILKNIKAGFDPEMSNSKDIEVIQDNARTKCPPVMQEFCDKVTHSKI